MAVDRFHKMTILAVRPATDNAIAVTLMLPPELRETFRYKAGQHLAVRTMLDGEEVRRTYSICSGPGDRDLTLAIKRVNDGWFSNWANDNLRPGDQLDVMAPAGRFVVPDGHAGRHLLCIAAGAGITPVLSIIKHRLAATGDDRITLLYGNRRMDQAIFLAEIEDLKDRHLGRINVVHVLSGPDAAEAPLLSGRIDGARVEALVRTLLAKRELEENVHVFACGPGSMIKEARDTLLRLGLPRDRFHYEFFAAAGGARRSEPLPKTERYPSTPKAQSVVAEAVAILDGSRHPFSLLAGETLVDAALRQGIKVPYSCRGGMCCTCRAKLVEGEARMALNYSLEPWEAEQGFILTCQALPDTRRVVVDYDQM